MRGLVTVSAALLAAAALTIPSSSQAQNAGCLDCHTRVTPRIMTDWQLSRHGQMGITCAACHGTEHTTQHDFEEAAIPTPATCATCHSQKVEEFTRGKHAVAWTAMNAMPTTHALPLALTEGMTGCGGCHKIGLKTEERGAGYGLGSCDACHTRHLFSAEEARQPQACQTCHMGFDHPQWEMYSTSKHGTIYSIEKEKWDWSRPLGQWYEAPFDPSTSIPRAPVCSLCHMPDGNHANKTAWGFLAMRLPEKDEEWLSYRQTILQGLGVLDAEGNPTERLNVVTAGQVARLTEEEWQAQRDRMLAVCEQCHTASYARQQMTAADQVIKEADKLMAEAVGIVQGLYRDGILPPPPDYPPHVDLLRFYEVRTPIEHQLFVMFLEHRMRTFQGAFHMNPDYMHWYGWAEMKRDLAEIRHQAAALRAAQE